MAEKTLRRPIKSQVSGVLELRWHNRAAAEDGAQCHVIRNPKAAECIEMAEVNRTACDRNNCAESLEHRGSNGAAFSPEAAQKADNSDPSDSRNSSPSPQRALLTANHYKGPESTDPAAKPATPESPNADVTSGTQNKKEQLHQQSAASRFTIYKVHKASKRKRERSSAKKENKATKTLAIVLGEWVVFRGMRIPKAVNAAFLLLNKPGTCNAKFTFPETLLHQALFSVISAQGIHETHSTFACPSVILENNILFPRLSVDSGFHIKLQGPYSRFAPALSKQAPFAFLDQKASDRLEKKNMTSSFAYLEAALRIPFMFATYATELLSKASESYQAK
ncbi:unnamed protein product [Notodromas monacha]|uniref:Uncharacterized protein n=1 Tax=Notodromas monacha TaxID=399045 RepID=A0A7R9G8M0_9CRUS|nr:unnamed protein product [Notodromas monacha]CAG0912243.1 unnamed protein product [Notodromas monacha]